MLMKYLPKLLSPNSTVTKTNDQEITNTITNLVKKKRVLPSWMTKKTQHGDQTVEHEQDQDEGQTVLGT